MEFLRRDAKLDPAGNRAVFVGDLEVKARPPKGRLPLDLALDAECRDQSCGAPPHSASRRDQGKLIAVDHVAHLAGGYIH